MKLITKTWLPILVGAIALIALCIWQLLPATVPLQALTIQLDWLHTPKFVGYYLADAKGYYAEQDLSIRYIEGGIKIDPVTNLVNGDAEFASVMAHHFLVARAAGNPVKAIACIMQRSPMVFATLKPSSILTPRDIVGKTVRISRQSQPLFAAMIKTAAPDGDYTLVQTNDLQKFISGEIDVWSGYLNGTMTDISAMGFQLNLIRPYEYGATFYDMCLVARDDFINDHPNQVAAFLAATIRGWEYTVQQPAETLRLTSMRYGDVESQEILDNMRISRTFIQTAQVPIGWMQADVWLNMANVLKRVDLLPADFDVTQAYTLSFLREYYQE